MRKPSNDPWILARSRQKWQRGSTVLSKNSRCARRFPLREVASHLQQADFHLVISNAKSFNPPGTIYHAEAERIEAFGAEHIAKAAAHVIEYETDWNIEIERDEEVNMEADDGDGAGAGAGGSIESGTPARRSPSVSSAAVPPVKRSRGAAKKGGPGMLSETLEPDGHLPGFKDGLAAFPPLSDWAELMVVLKLKGEELTRSLVENNSLYHARWFTTELGDRRRDSSPRHSRLLSQQYLH